MNHPAHCCCGHSKLLCFSCEMVAGVKVKPPPETRRCSSAGGGSQRRRGGMILSYLSTCTHTYCWNSASTSSSNTPESRQFQSTPALKPTLIHIPKCNQELRSCSSFCHTVLPFLHFSPVHFLSLSSQSSVIDLSPGGRNQPLPLFLDIQPRAQTQPGIWA